MNYVKMPADRNVAVWLGPSGGTTLGITDIDEPTEAELNNTGGTSGMQQASQSISWNDYDFGIQASETLNEPSLADAGSYVEFGQSNYSGSISFFRPRDYDDNSNQHSIIYDLTDEMYHLLDVAVRIDGEVRATAEAEDGDFVSTYRVQSGADANPFTPGESKRRTVTYSPKSDFSHYTVVGDHAITAIGTATADIGDKGRIRASQQGRDRTNALRVSTTTPALIEVFPGGFYRALAAGSAAVVFTDEGTGDTVSHAITIS